MSTMPFGSFAQGQNINKENQNVQQLKANKGNILQSGRKAPLGDLKNTQGLSGFDKNLKSENKNIFNSAKKSTLFGDIKNINTFKGKVHMSKTETKKKLTSTVAEAAITPKNRNLPTRKTILNDHDAFMFERSEKFKNLEYQQASKNVLNDTEINNIIFAKISSHDNGIRKGLFSTKQNLVNNVPDIVLTTNVYEDSDDEDSIPKFEKFSLFN